MGEEGIKVKRGENKEMRKIGVSVEKWDRRAQAKCLCGAKFVCWLLRINNEHPP